MIDQLPTAVPQTAQAANTANRERKQAAAEKDDQGGSFEDIVSKAGQKQSHEEKGKKAEIELRPQSEAETRRSTDGRVKTAFALSAALRGFGTSQEGKDQAQVQINAQAQLRLTAKDIARIANVVEQEGEQAEAALANLAEKLTGASPLVAEVREAVRKVKLLEDAAQWAEKFEDAVSGAEQLDDGAHPLDKVKDAIRQAEKLAGKIREGSGDVAADAEVALTPSDELGLLLGLTKETDAKHSRKSADADTVKKVDEDERESHADKLAANNEAPRISQVAAAADAKVARDNPVADDKSSQNDVVRLVSANGRGRPVDVDVPAVPGETQRDAAKAATTAKVDTATVLEARRYLGFTPEPNATALTTAIKADPTWTEALHAAQASDLSALGNTVTEVNTLKLQMNPENLGNMVASLKIKGEELTVELRVDSIEAYQQLSADHDDIVKGLQDQGFSIDKVTVQLNATDRTDTGADRDMARQGQRDGETQQRDGQDDRRSGRNERQSEQPRWTPSGTAADGSAGDSRADAGRPDNIYI